MNYDFFFRFRKLERIEQLNNEVKKLKDEKEELKKEGEVLKTEVTSLRRKLEEHIENGFCEIDFLNRLNR